MYDVYLINQHVWLLQFWLLPTLVLFHSTLLLQHLYNNTSSELIFYFCSNRNDNPPECRDRHFGQSACRARLPRVRRAASACGRAARREAARIRLSLTACAFRGCSSARRAPPSTSQTRTVRPMAFTNLRNRFYSSIVRFFVLTRTLICLAANWRGIETNTHGRFA